MKTHYNQFTYVQPTFQERIAFEYGNSVPTDTEITEYIFDRLIFHYKQVHTYGEDYFTNDIDLFEYIVRHFNACAEGRWKIKDCYNPAMLSYVAELNEKKDLYYYLQTRVSYLWELFRLADEGMLPDYLPLTNQFDPENKYIDKLKEDYEEDYKRVLFLCSETKIPAQRIKFLDKDRTIRYVKKGRGWYPCKNREEWDNYYDRITHKYLG